MPELSKPLRFTALIIGISSIIATLVLVIIREPVPGSLLRFFTILTNFTVSYVLIMAAIRGHWRSFGLFTASTLWIWLVGTIYHSVLASTHNPEGIAAVTNHIHHTLVPFGTFLIWIFTKPRVFIKRSAPVFWLIFPLFYTGYMLLRGYMDGIYPYH